jgi:peptide/nickel transport system substrate-binding protein
LTCVWLDTGTPRSERVVLEANHDHWNSERGPRLERVVFRNELPPAEALELVCDGEGEVDIVTEVSPADAQRVIASEHAKLVRVDAMRVLAGIVNWAAEGAPLHDVRARRALNLAVDRGRLIREVFGGYAAPLAGLTPHYAAGVPAGQQPYQHDPDQARDLLTTAGWPAGRELRLTAPADLEAVARRLAEDFTASSDSRST